MRLSRAKLMDFLALLPKCHCIQGNIILTTFKKHLMNIISHDCIRNTIIVFVIYM